MQRRIPTSGGHPTHSANVVWQAEALSLDQRRRALGVTGGTVWFTGLPAAGKTTIAGALERELVYRGRLAYRLDGDNLRHGLNADLGFAPADRAENVRRTSHVARLLADAGVLVLVALISPYRADRHSAREAHDHAGLPFVEVFVDTPLATCETRDPKGLYARARTGELRGMTGVDAPYEPPEHPDIVLTPGEVKRQVENLVGLLRSRGLLVAPRDLATASS